MFDLQRDAFDTDSDCEETPHDTLECDFPSRDSGLNALPRVSSSAVTNRDRLARSTLFERKTTRADDGFARELIALRGELHARALRLTRNPAAADDLVQDSIERALRFRAQFTPGTSLRSWAQTIVFTLFITGYRRRRREREAVRSLTVDPCAWTASEPMSVEGAQRDLSPPLRKALDSLPKAFRDVLLMVDVGDYSYRDAADALGVPIGTVMSRLHRARKQLAAAIDPNRPTPPRGPGPQCGPPWGPDDRLAA